MKIKKLILPIICTALLCSCNQAEHNAVKPTAVEENLSATAKITQGDFKCSAKIKRQAASVWEWEFTSPKSINGMKATLSGDNCLIDFKGMKYTLDRKKLPKGSMISLLSKSIDRVILQKELECSEENGEITEKGVTDGLDFTAQVKEGKIVSVSVNDEIFAEIK